MKLRILACSGRTGRYLRTASMLPDNKILIDAGTGVGNSSLKELTQIKPVVGHSYLDHVSRTPFLGATVGWMRNMPITVQTVRATQKILKQRIFNWKIRPDFTHVSGPREVEECAANHRQEMLWHNQFFIFQADILRPAEMRF